MASLGLPGQGHALPGGKRGAASGGTDKIRIARADNLSEEREHEHEHSMIAVTVYVGDVSSPKPTRAGTSIGARRTEHATPGAKQGAARTYASCCFARLDPILLD